MQLSELVFRRATENDIDAMHRIRMSVKENILSNPALVTREHYINYLSEYGVGWVCETGNQLLGFAILDLMHSNVWALFVDPGAEGTGIGNKLHEAMVHYYFENTAAPLKLSTAAGTRAERFYKERGWVEIGRKVNDEIIFSLSNTSFHK